MILTNESNNNNNNNNDDTSASYEESPLIVRATINNKTNNNDNTESHHPAALKTTSLVMLIVSVAIGIVSGTMYAFGRYSRELKYSLGLSQFQLEQLGILLDSGNYVGHPLTGLIYDTFGPRFSCGLAATIVFLSYGLIHQGLSSRQQNTPPFFVFALCFVFVGFGSGLGYIAGLGTTTKNFQTTRYSNLAIGIVATGFGLSSTFVGISYKLVGLEHFFLLWAVLVAVVNIVGVFFLAPSNQNDEDELLQDHTAEHKYDSHDEELVAIALPPLHHHHAENENNNGNTQNKDADSSSEAGTQETSSIVSSYQRGETETHLRHHHHHHHHEEEERKMMIQENVEPSDHTATKKKQQQSSSLSQWQSWRTFDFWLLFFCFACCAGCGLFVINNISTIVQSMGGSDSFSGKLVILLSLSNCSGRILMGSLADRPHLKKKKVSLLAGAALVMSFALFTSAAAWSTTGSGGGGPTMTQSICLTLTVILVAASYGGTWIMIVSILAEWFGNYNFGKNYGLIALGPALSGMFFNTASAWMYQKAIIVSKKAMVVAIEVDDSSITTTTTNVTAGISSETTVMMDSSSFVYTTTNTTTSGDNNFVVEDQYYNVNDDDDACFGPACYRGAFLMTGTAALISFFLILYLAHRRRIHRIRDRHHRS